MGESSNWWVFWNNEGWDETWACGESLLVNHDLEFLPVTLLESFRLWEKCLDAHSDINSPILSCPASVGAAVTKWLPQLPTAATTRVSLSEGDIHLLPQSKAPALQLYFAGPGAAPSVYLALHGGSELVVETTAHLSPLFPPPPNSSPSPSPPCPMGLSIGRHCWSPSQSYRPC